jgi:hypothetical protein
VLELCPRRLGGLFLAPRYGCMERSPALGGWAILRASSWDAGDSTTQGLEQLKLLFGENQMLSFLFVLLAQPFDSVPAKSCCAAQADAPTVARVSATQSGGCCASAQVSGEASKAAAATCCGSCEECRAKCGGDCENCKCCSPEECRRCCGGDGKNCCGGDCKGQCNGDCKGKCGGDCKSSCGGADVAPTSDTTPTATKVRAETRAGGCGCKKQASRS